MRDILTISIDKELKKSIAQKALDLNTTQSELVKQAIRKYIIHQELQELREMLIPYAERGGYYTDEDVFKDIS
ncbi:CopG family transcriptional regulator [bacterium]|nr:MAG: CopG family transcriptional regulator [bacterium]